MHLVGRGPLGATLLALVALAAGPEAAMGQGPLGAVTCHVTSEGHAVADAEVWSDSTRIRTDAAGTATLELPLGRHVLRVRKMGYAPDSVRVTVLATPVAVAVHLEEVPVRMAEVVVSATRAERRIEDEPTRVEVTGREDVGEQLAASPGNIAELLTEASGVRVQPYTAGLGGAGVRIRGLPGRYTKILSDGLPLYGLSAEGLGPLQIPPMDLERVEVIKGAASALYGPTALAGVVNLVTQRPGSQHEALVNQTSRDGSDAVLWDSRRLNRRWGYTLLASADRQSRKDVNGDGWADLPGFRRGVIRPRWFWNGPGGDSWFLTSGVTVENRQGGTVAGALLPDGAPFRENLDTRRFDVGSVARLELAPDRLLSLRGSLTGEWRTHDFGAVRERDRRSTAFGEATVTLTHGSQVLVAGVAAERDGYRATDVPRMDYAYLTPGLFVEHLWAPVRWLSLSSSARLDFHSRYGDYLSPRESVLFRVGRGWTARIAGGAGIFAPTPFTEDTEVIGLSRLRPIGDLGVERAQSASADVSGRLGPVEVDASAFKSVVGHPVGIRPVPGDSAALELVNAREPMRVGGVELFARYERDPVTVTGSYTYLDGSQLNVESGVRTGVPLDPRHEGGLTVVYEEEGGTRAGLELYYIGRQTLADDPYRATSRPYASVDALLERRCRSVTLFLHGEDLNDVRQSRYEPLLRPGPDAEGRWTTDTWASLEGRVISGGLRWQY